MRCARVVLGVVAIAALGCPRRAPVEDVTRWRVSDVDPIAGVGHGALFDGQGREFTPTPAQVIEAQRFYIRKLHDGADERQRAELRRVQQRLHALEPRSAAEQILVQAALVDWLIAAVRPADAPQLLSKSGALRNVHVRLVDGAPPARSPAGTVREGFLDKLARAGGLTFLSATRTRGSEYIEECARAGVPIPPDWRSPQWTRRGELSKKFISQSIGAELWVYESAQPRGVCMALPRWDGDSTNLLGVICLGVETSKACFWDNDHRQGQRVGKGDFIPLGRFLGGTDLNLPNQVATGGICTDCHAGENPYVVHPREPMDLGGAIRPKVWSEPLVDGSWPQNPGPTNVLNGVSPPQTSCLGCHGAGARFPDVSTQLPLYCKIVLTQAYQRTMPDGNPNDPAFQKDYDALQTACGRAPSSGVAINGATQSSPTTSRSDTTVTLSACAGKPDCPLGFCYWKAVHGPFWQTTPSSIPIGDAAFRGSFARIFAEGGEWKARVLVDPTGGPPIAPPGGFVQCLNFRDIATVPDPANCGSGLFTVFDDDGKHASQSVDAGPLSAYVLSGLIGNVAQTNVERPDTLAVTDRGGTVVLAQRHSLTPQPPPLQIGPLTGEAWTNGCAGWTPAFAVKDVLSTSDVLLVPAAQADKVRCFITGVTGAWSSTRNQGTVQPFAEIYETAGKDIRLRVSPSGEVDRVGALASCIFVN